MAPCPRPPGLHSAGACWPSSWAAPCWSRSWSGSGIAAQQLSPNDVGLQLLENSTATFLGLTVLILLFGPVSGAHFNPVVSLADWFLGRRTGHGLPLGEVGGYAVAQVAGAVAGAMLANLMFGVATTVSTKDRTSGGHLLAEVVATTFLVALIFALARTGRGALAAPAVGAYIGAAYWFTSSTSFANPAVTVGRVFSDTFAGIAPGSAGAFVAVQLVGLVIGAAVILALYPDIGEQTDDVVLASQSHQRGSAITPDAHEPGPPDEPVPSTTPEQESGMDITTRDPYPAIVEDLTYAYEGVFSAESVAAAVTAARGGPRTGGDGKNLPADPGRAARQGAADVRRPGRGTDRQDRCPSCCSSVCTTPAGRRWLPRWPSTCPARRVHVRSAGSAPAGRSTRSSSQVLAERGITLTEAVPETVVRQRRHAPPT